MQRKHRLVQFYRSRCPREVGDEVMEVTSRFLDVATGRGNRGSVPGSARAPSSCLKATLIVRGRAAVALRCGTLAVQGHSPVAPGFRLSLVFSSPAAAKRCAEGAGLEGAPKSVTSSKRSLILSYSSTPAF